jgi:CelD/BcsL family acetyltransferase involved in cellulose biosynthesis
MAITVHRYTEENRVEWETFVARCSNATMFHEQAFLDYHPDGRFVFEHLMFREDGVLVAVLPGGFFKGREHAYWSPVGASYGGFCAPDADFALALRVVDVFLETAKARGWNDAYIIPPPIIYSNPMSQHFEYAMLYRKCDFELHYISHAIQLQPTENHLSVFDKTARKTIHKIRREQRIRIEDSEDYASFHRILVANKAKHDAKPTHSLEDLLRLKELMPSRLRLMMVYEGDTPIAGSLLFFANTQVVLCFYNMLLYEYEHLKPVYLIMDETVKRAREEGYAWVDIGVSQDTKSDNPMTPSLGLIEFKERFDSHGVLRSTYHFGLNPA